MDFYEVLDQVVDLLKQRGRVTYRALKAQFQMDDELLDTLKDELLFSHPVVDEDGRGLVWTGETGNAPKPSSQPDQPTPQSVGEQTQPVRDISPPVEPHTPDAERRQLTVMFIDLAESTALAGELDPEDYREVVRQYQQVCSEIIQRYDGYVAQLLGDGLLVYFGYPVAHEEDAQRAIHTGLGIVEAIGTLNTRLEQIKGIKLAVRLGIHTGLVVVGEMGGAGRQEQLALGEVPNIASRLEGSARPNTIVISDATYRLVQGYFDCEPLGEHDLRGLSQPIAIYCVFGDTGIQSRLDVASARGLTPLVGRASEVTLLLERWEQAKEGQGQVVLLSGEAGIGKSRLVQVLKDHVAEGAHTRLECRSSPYFTNSALYPITDMIQRTLRFQVDDTPEQKLEQLIENLRHYRLPLEETVPLFGALLSLPVPEDQYPPLNLSPQRQRQKTLESIVAIILELAERQPVLFILEDLHWTDPTTLEFLELLVEQTPTASLYVLLTCRPEFQPSWSHRSYLTEITVNRLSREQITGMAEDVAGGKHLPEEVLQQIIQKSDGVPLYVEEMTKAILESGSLKDVNGHYKLASSLASVAIPATLQDSLMARLDRLVTAKAVAQYASVIGRQFSYELLQAVSQLDETMLQHELGRLVEAELVYQRGGIPHSTYIFKHALIQDTACESLLRSTRQGYHRRIAEVLEQRFPETAETQPELLAQHYTEAGLNEQAVNYWYKAGQHASERSAHVEAIAHLNKGLEALRTLPESPERMQRELDFQILLALAYHASKGQSAPELEQAYLWARELCEHIDDDHQLFHVLMGLYRCYGGRGQHQKCWDCANELVRVAQRVQDPHLLLETYMVQGTLMLHDGEFEDACEQLEQCLALYRPHDHRVYIAHSSIDPGVTALSRLSWTLWFLGYPQQALSRSRETLALARKLGHVNSLGMACNFAALLHQFCRESQSVYEQVQTATALATEYALYVRQLRADIMAGWCLVHRGQGEAGIAQMQQGLTDYTATGTTQYREWYLALLAKAYGHEGQHRIGLETLAEAMTLVRRGEGTACWEPELHRLKGQLLLQQSPDNATEAETCFHQAITIAQNQSAKSWELRAATSLAKLWQSQNKRDEARELLEPVYSWFTEGFDTADLIDAKTLLDELS